MNVSAIGELIMTGPAHARAHAIALITGVVMLLTMATLVGYALKRNLGRTAPQLVIDNLITRIKAWWVIATIFALAVLAGSIGILSLFAFASLAALREFVPNRAPYPGSSPELVLGALSLLAAQYVFIWMQWTTIFIVFLPACLLLLSLSQALQSQFIGRNHQLLWGMALCVYFIGHAPALLMLEIPGHEDRNGYLVVFLVLVTQLGDVLQYIWGKLLGRHKVAPIISPQKTVEGTIGGIASATLLGAGLAAITPFSVAQAAAIACALAMLGFLGGLALSAIKRRRGIKDWGRLIPGHGGMLDRLDSLVLSAPLLFYIVWLGWSV